MTPAVSKFVATLPENNSAFTPENLWLEDDVTPIFRAELLLGGSFQLARS